MRKPPRQEIIEIGAVMIDERGEQLSEFSRFVKPKLNPKLSSFCKELTSIQQHKVDGADDFQEVIWDFEDWMEVDDQLRLCSWGDYDRNQLLKDGELHDIHLPWLNQFFCLKQSHARLLNLKEPVGVKTALEFAGLSFEGTSHRAIADARNTGRILQQHYDEWIPQLRNH